MDEAKSTGTHHEVFLLQHEGEGDVDVLGAAAVVGPGHRGHRQRGVGEAARVAAHRHWGLVDVPAEGGTEEQLQFNARVQALRVTSRTTACLALLLTR